MERIDSIKMFTQAEVADILHCNKDNVPCCVKQEYLKLSRLDEAICSPEWSLKTHESLCRVRC